QRLPAQPAHRLSERRRPRLCRGARALAGRRDLHPPPAQLAAVRPPARRLDRWLYRRVQRPDRGAVAEGPRRHPDRNPPLTAPRIRRLSSQLADQGTVPTGTGLSRNDAPRQGTVPPAHHHRDPNETGTKLDSLRQCTHSVLSESGETERCPRSISLTC